MPEGDVVWRTARRLHQALAGEPVLRWDLRWPSLAETDLTGGTVLDVASRGKHLLLRLTGDWTLHSHLRMEGSWRLQRAELPPPSAARADVRAVVGGPHWTAVGYRLGMLDLVRTSDEERLVGHLGPDLLGPDWDAAAVVAAIAGDPGRAIGESLLDQRVLAGVGTFFLCEACFLRGVTPWTPAGATDVVRMVELVHRLLTMNRDRAVQVTTGDARRGQEQWVHSRSGRPCRRCGTTVRVAPLGVPPQDRVAFYCPSCQRGPTPTDDGRPQRPLGATARGTRSTPPYRRA